MKNKEYFLKQPEVRKFFLKNPDCNLYLQMIGYNNFHFIKASYNLRTQAFFTLHFILSGKGYLKINDKMYNIYKHQIFFIDNKSTFAYYPDSDDPWEYVFFEFNEAIAHEFISSLGFNKTTHILDCKNPQNLMLILKENLEKLEKEKTISYFSALSVFLTTLDSIHAEDQFADYLYDNNFIEEVKSFIRLRCLNPDFNIPEICKSMNISHTHLSRIFKNNEHMSIIDYINEIKLNKAKSLLENKNICLKEIAQISGFKDYDYFCRFFKNKTKMTPTEYHNYIMKKF